MLIHRRNWFCRLLAIMGILAGVTILLAGIAFTSINIWPNLGAGTVDLARGIVGDKLVSEVENFILSSEDKITQICHTLIKTTPVAPWQVASLPTSNPAMIPTYNKLPTFTPPVSNIGTSASLPTPTLSGWTLENVPPLGTTPGEGQWMAYLSD